MNHSHQPGPCKQSNKLHKHGKHRSKGEINRKNHGRVAIRANSQKNKHDLSRTERRTKAQQIRKNKREAILATKRSIGGEKSAPHYVAVVPLHDNCCVENLVKLLTECDEQITVTTSGQGSTHASYPRFKQRVAYVTPDPTNLHSLLDAVSACDTILFLWSLDLLDARAEYNYKALYAAGMPSHLHVITGIKSLVPKKQAETKKFLQMEVESRFVSGKLYLADTEADAQNLVRTITQHKVKIPRFREIRPTVVCEELDWVQAQSENGQTNENQNGLGTLRVTGYVKGCGLSANRLVHIPGYGDYQLEKITAPVDPHPLILKPDKFKYVRPGDEEEKLLARADPLRQTDLQTENDADELDGEQTWPTDEEMKQAQMEQKRLFKVPKGTSAYQAAWIRDEAVEGESLADDVSDQLFDSDEELEDLGPVSAAESDDEMELDDRGSVSGSIAPSSIATKSVTWGDDVAYDKTWDEDAERAQLALYKKEREQMLFPDEVDTPENIPARERFARYRGLSSFRTSPWDPKENLPQDYSRIFQFENFSRFRRHITDDEPADAVIPGWYVTIDVKNVSKQVYDSYSTTRSSLVLIGLLPHEHRMSVLHFTVRRSALYTEPIRSKQQMVVHCGFRRYTCNPIYSDHSNINKHKFERFLPQSGVCIASVYAPITFPPCSVSLYKYDINPHTGLSEPTLVASGSLLSVDPDRIMLKRIVLSGHPCRVNKRNAVVRYLLWNREDIAWFKPIELKTKWGRRGHIKEPIGTHGHMKCLFDQQLKSQDTVLLMLYKRVFPKWTYDQNVASNLSQHAETDEQPEHVDTAMSD